MNSNSCLANNIQSLFWKISLAQYYLSWQVILWERPFSISSAHEKTVPYRYWMWKELVFFNDSSTLQWSSSIKFGKRIYTLPRKSIVWTYVWTFWHNLNTSTKKSLILERRNFIWSTRMSDYEGRKNLDITFEFTTKALTFLTLQNLDTNLMSVTVWA